MLLRVCDIYIYIYTRTHVGSRRRRVTTQCDWCVAKVPLAAAM